MNPIQFIESISLLTYASIGVSVLVALLFFRVFFDDVGDFLDCIVLAFQPEIITIFRGQWSDSQWAGVKVTLWLLPSIVSGYLAYSQLPASFPGVFH